MQGALSSLPFCFLEVGYDSLTRDVLSVFFRLDHQGRRPRAPRDLALCMHARIQARIPIGFYHMIHYFAVYAKRIA